MSSRWFRPCAGAYRPASWQGWLLTILAAAWCAHIFVAIDRVSHSATDTLYGVFPFWAPCLIVLYLVAERTSALR